MLAVMKARLDASRALLYETARFVDMYKIYEDIARERDLSRRARRDEALQQARRRLHPLS